ncbi:MAG: GNAT family N-acetyltransferase [bacterium]|nr:GNAT family N-acetyltransferase [bacterium]
MAIIEPGKKFVSTSAQKKGGELFDHVLASPDSAIFLAQEKNSYIGILTIYKIPQIRKGGYCAEIEEMFVKKSRQGKGVSQRLLAAAIQWARKENIDSIRLESSAELKRAHAFYTKAGFTPYGQAFIKHLSKNKKSRLSRSAGNKSTRKRAE